MVSLRGHVGLELRVEGLGMNAPYGFACLGLIP